MKLNHEPYPTSPLVHDYTTGPYDFNNIYNPGITYVTSGEPGLYVVKVSWSSLIFMKDRIYDM